VERSLKQRRLSHRQTLAGWHRDNVDIHSVYDVLETIGQGSLGEVTVVRKKQEALRVVERRVSRSSSTRGGGDGEDVSSLSLSVAREGYCGTTVVSGGASLTKKQWRRGSFVPFVAVVRKGGKGIDSNNADNHVNDHAASTALPAPPPPAAASSPSSSFPPSPPPPPRKFACKTMATSRMTSASLSEFLNEITILRDLDHPNIIQLFEVYQSRHKLWLVTELCTGGDLSARIPDETQSVLVLEQILRAVRYMHERNVRHGDIKLENVVFVTKDVSCWDVKLVDFGLASGFARGEKSPLAPCGTIYTLAPELLALLTDGQADDKRNSRQVVLFTELADIWAVGVVAWILQSQTYPFLTGMADLQCVRKQAQLREARYVFGEEWGVRGITRYGKEFCARCLRKHVGLRWRADEALKFVQEVWLVFLEGGAEMEASAEISEEGESYVAGSGVTTGIQSRAGDADHTNSSDEKRHLHPSLSFLKKSIRMKACTLQGMQKFTHHGELKKTILMTMAYTMDKSNLQELRQIFTVLDRGSTGTIEFHELKQALKDMHHCPNNANATAPPPSQQSSSSIWDDDATIESLFRGIDMDNSGQIHYMEFLAAVAESQGLITRERLAEAFERLDADGKGYISKSDLRDVLGMDYSEDLVNRMIDEADYKRNGQVDYDEFLRLMFDDGGSATFHAEDCKG